MRMEFPLWFVDTVSFSVPLDIGYKQLLGTFWGLAIMLSHAGTNSCIQLHDLMRKRSLFLFFFQFIYLVALGLSCGMWDLVPWPGIKPGLPALGLRSLSHWITWEVLEGKYWVGQKVCLDFPIRCYGKCYYFYYNTILLLLYYYYHHFSGEKNVSQKVMRLAA